MHLVLLVLLSKTQVFKDFFVGEKCSPPYKNIFSSVRRSSSTFIFLHFLVENLKKLNEISDKHFTLFFTLASIPNLRNFIFFNLKNFSFPDLAKILINQ
ncbi:unnamed protein product [Meloidogyne enterolobii]|uniref:Uncharacterized protein n=1 Tax=Meloidogyne enterolobii TaxID=390850 RepID=A0ACB0YDQ0_MELEN